MFKVTEATGCPFDEKYLLKEDRKFDIRDFGADTTKTPVENTRAINSAIQKASETGGTVVIPKGDFRVYTIHLMSGVNIYMSEGSILHAAKTDIKTFYEKQAGEGGNYDEPEVNPYVGLQDHGHTYFANSLIYGADIHDVMIYGPGLIDGSFLNEKGELDNVLMGGDPHEPARRSDRGHRGEWFGNKAIALVRCENVALCDFSIVAGGHFAIITTCVKNLFVNHILIDTNRDAFDIDCCQNVTVRNSTFNSLTDDALVMKASYGGGIFMPLKNVLIEDCMVCGYDMGSVYTGKFTTDKLIATDRCGPTGRVKLGTESTCGYDCVTVRRVHFKRSRGFALEAVDGSDLSNIIFEDSTMEDVSSSPIFVRAGDRGRFPVTGISADEDLVSPMGKRPDIGRGSANMAADNANRASDNINASLKSGNGDRDKPAIGMESGALDSRKPNVRLDNVNWVLPAKSIYRTYPAKRYLPSYNRTRKVSVDGRSYFQIVDQENPCKLNPVNYHEENGKFFALKYDESQMKYVPDYDKELKENELVLYANANGSDHIANVHDVIIRNITVKNADPRYPIELMGLDGSRIRNIIIENVKVEYRGGLSMRDAVEQRQLNTNWEYKQNNKNNIQALPWLVNTFFLKNEGLLPRVEWDPKSGSWKDAPFNVPELPEVYPEPSNWGILPAYGLYVRHVENLMLNNIEMSYIIEDGRHPVVLDDVVNGCVKNIRTAHAEGLEEIVCVRNYFKRPAGFEYVPDYEYHETKVENVEIDANLSVKHVEVRAPAPGTPKDSLYPYETVAIPENGYNFACPTEDYPLPQTVYRPFFVPVKAQYVKAGERLTFDVIARQPAFEASSRESEGRIYNEPRPFRHFTVCGIAVPMKMKVCNLPEGADFDPSSFVPGQACTFSWTPTADAVREEPYRVTFIADDGIIPVQMDVDIIVTR